MAAVEWLVDKALKTGHMASWRVMKLDGLVYRACRPMDAKVKGNRTYNRVAKVKEVSINQGDIPSNARTISLKGIHK